MLFRSPSFGNFLLLDITKTNHTPQEVFMFMQQSGVIVRPVEIYGLMHHIRISIGTTAENDQALKLFAQLLSMPEGAIALG